MDEQMGRNAYLPVDGRVEWRQGRGEVGQEIVLQHRLLQL